MPRNSLQILRGAEIDQPLLVVGEPGFAIDAHRLLIGDGAVNWSFWSKSELDSFYNAAFAAIGHTHLKAGITDLEEISATPAANLIPKAGGDGKLAGGWFPFGSGAGTVCQGNDARLSNTRTPSDLSVTNAQVATGAAIAESKLALNYATHSTANDPSAGQKAALAGTSGTPADANRYVTDGDARNANARIASDVYAWAKASTKPAYTYTEVGAAAASHTHAATDIASANLDIARMPTGGEWDITTTVLYGGLNVGALLLQTTTAASGVQVLMESFLYANPAGASSAGYRAIKGAASIPAANAQNFSGALVGLQFEALHGGSGVHSGYACGLSVDAGTVGTGSLATAYGIYVNTVKTSTGAITTSYGLYLDTCAVATNRWGVYQVGASDVNYFAGRVGIGVAPTAAYLQVGGTVTSAAASERGFLVNTTFGGAGISPAGFSIGPTFKPSGNITYAWGAIFQPMANPPAGSTITNFYANFSRVTTPADNTGAVTNAYGFTVGNPIFDGIKPTTNYGLQILNQGVAGVTTSYGLYIDAQSGSTTPWAIYSVGGVSYHAGNFLVGTLTNGMTAGGSLAVAQDFAHRGTKYGVFNTTPITKPSGNALTALANLGLVTSPTLAAADVAAAPQSALTLSNGLNSNIAKPSTSWVRITGPTADFAIGGFTGGTDGAILTLYNTTGHYITSVNEDASSSAANRVVGSFSTMQSLTFQYSGADSRWIVVGSK